MQSTVNLLAAMPNDNLSYKPHPVNRSAKEIAEHNCVVKGEKEPVFVA